MITLWNRYWFKDNGAYSLAILRIAVGIAFLLCQHAIVAPDLDIFFSLMKYQAYQPTGILSIYPGVPSKDFLNVCRVIALASPWFLILGLYSRTSIVLCVGSNLIMHELIASYIFYTVAFHMVFLAALALLGSDAGQALSVDGWIRRRTGRALVAPPGASRWPVYLAQISLTMVFFNAVIYKLKSDDFHFGWALSDNLRNIICWRYLSWHEQIPKIASFIASSELCYKTAALSNILCQGLCILACVSVSLPRLRIFFGALFAMEALGLAFVMGFPCLHWFPLLVVFVDWEQVIDWYNGRNGNAARPLDPLPGKRKIAVSAFISIYLGALVYGAFFHTRFSMYPFRASTPFCFIMAKRPYSEHQPFEFVSSRIEIDGAEPANPREASWIYYMHQDLSALTDLEAVERAARSIQQAERSPHGILRWELGGMPRIWNWLPDQRKLMWDAWAAAVQRKASFETDTGTIRSIHVFKVLYQIPPYPASPTLKKLGDWPQCILRRDGTFIGVSACAEKDCYQVLYKGLKCPRFSLAAVSLADGTVSELTGKWMGDKFLYDKPLLHKMLLIRVLDPVLRERLSFAGPIF